MKSKKIELGVLLILAVIISSSWLLVDIHNKRPYKRAYTSSSEVFTDLVKDEGFKNLPYRDSRGILTIGYGRNLTDTGITHDEGIYLLLNDIRRCIRQLKINKVTSKAFMNLLMQPVKNKNIIDGLIEMTYNMGIHKVAKFKKMWFYLDKGDNVHAGMAILRSKWYHEEPARAEKIASLITYN